ncbi:metal-nicotianamine transporter YSL1-like, partial [Trifolium medium]|nr:metal-nicotianamine transporter YSL1-like [Trifolium medium]
MWIGVVGYGVFTTISIIIIPHMFPQLKWYYVIVAYIFAPALAFCNAFGA